MASNRNYKDIQWLLQVVKSESINVKSISFSCSQPTSSCYQETEDSISASISKDNISFFSNILSDLGTAKNLQSSLTNLEFNHVEWGLEQVVYLGILVQNSSSIKRLVFQQNRFSRECLQEFSEVFKSNRVIKELVFCESGIGSFGAGLIASSLKINQSLEELQIWEDSIGSKGAEEMSKMIEMNFRLKLLTIFDLNFITAAPLISAVLARNRAMEVHVWSAENEKKSSKVVEFVPGNSTLRIYKLDVSGSCRVACSLGMNTTVKSLDMTGVRLKSRWAKEFRWVLEHNSTLKEVRLSKTCLKDKGVVYLAAGIFKNRSLERMYLDGNWFSGVGVEHLLCPLSRFSSLQMQANITLKSVTFGGGRTKIGRNGLAAITQMLTTNETLFKLGIYDDKSLRPDDIVKIFRSLEKNASLRYLSLQGCRGVQGELVLKTIMETLQVNPWIEEIDLGRTPLHNSGKADGIYQRLGKNENIEPEADIDLLADMPLAEPKTCRVFLCGQEYAGKFTLCSSISQSFSTSKLPYIDHIRTLVNPIEQAVRTSGMTIKTFRDEDMKISIWNLGGQHLSFALRDLMFPGHGSPSLFLIVSSLFRKPNNHEAKTAPEIEEDLQYWLRFIVSNSRRAHRQSMLPSVTIVLTHHDRINQSSRDLQLVVDPIERVREKFQNCVDMYPTVFTVDARSSVSVSKLTHHLQKTSKTLLQRVPRVYQMCNDLAQILSDWRTENYNKPMMKWKEFAELCQVKVPALRMRSRHVNKEKVEMRRKAVASCLHHIGEVIYFEELSFLILDCEWFCSHILSELEKLDVKKQSSVENNGFISRTGLERNLRESMQSRQIPGLGSKVFENLDASDLVRMMLKLELCYEQDPSDPNSPLLIPSSLDDGRKKPQRWQLNSSECVYVGRHLECEDSGHMFLTPGFFPCLQVRLHNKVMVLKNQHGATYSLEKHLIVININGIHIRVELGGQLEYYIDVLACSTKNLTEMLRVIHQLVIPAIQSLCHGVTFRESIIRPECVQNLIAPRYRKSQHVSVQLMKQALLSVPADSMYDYQYTWDAVTDSGRVILGPGFDLARDLLSEDDFREVLHRRYHDLYNLATELDVPPERNSDKTNQQNSELDKVDPSFTGIAKGVEQVLQRLKIIEQELRDLKQEIQGLRYYEHRLLIELHRKVNYLVNYNIQVEERKVPNMFFFVRTENYSRRLVTSIISGMTALRMHMLCEFRREMHVVEDQIGCETMQVDNIAVKSLAPYMKKFMMLVTFALKIGAHLAAGMGEMIPDLSREVAHLTGSSLLYGAAGAAAAGVVGAAAMGHSRESSRNIQEDVRAAQQWLVDFLRERRCSSGKDIAEKFGLWRVRYRDDGEIAWICRRHMSMRANEIIEAPI